MDKIPQGVGHPWQNLWKTPIVPMSDQNKNSAAAEQRPTERSNGACVKGEGQNGSRTNITNK